MTEPLFSVVIPTKNRAFLLRHAIDSLLHQTFENFEVIIADNDDTDDTARLVQSYNDPRINHLRTGGLSMPDNWEAGAAEAKGVYLCVIEDKQALKKRALERLERAVRQHNPRVIKWRYDRFEDGSRPVRLRLAKSESLEPSMVSSEELLRQFCGELKTKYKAVLPLPQLSAIHRDLLREVRQGPMKRLFHAVSPDVILALLALNLADEVLDFRTALGVYSSTTHSNGKSAGVKGALFQQFLKQLGIDESRLFDKVPVQSFTVPGSIFNDFMHIRERAGGRLAAHELNWAKFFYETQGAIWSAAQQGVDVADQQAAWDEAFARQPDDVQSQTRDALAPGEKNRASQASPWRRVSERAGIHRLERRVKAFVRGRLRGDLEWRFRNVEEYLAWDSARSDADS